MILPRRWVPKHEPILKIERTMAMINDKPMRRNTITQQHRDRGVQSRRGTTLAKQLLERLGL